MTNEEKLRFTLIDGLKYGLKIQIKKSRTFEMGSTVSIHLNKTVNEWYIQLVGFTYSVTDCKPHLRPMSELVNRITVPGYNEGKPFVPIKQLLKEQESTWFKDALPRYEKITHGFDGRRVRAFVTLHTTKSIDLHVDFIHNWPCWIIEFLDMWHFNRRDLPESMYIKIQE